MNTSKNVKIEWPKEAVLVLVEAWEQNECLYNSKSEHYHNKHATNAALENLLKEVECYVPNITTNEIKTKLNYLRTQYCRELAKVKESYRSGCGCDEIYTPTTYWFDNLNFLRSYVNIKKGSSSVAIVSDSDVLETEYLEPVAATPPSQKKRRKGFTPAENTQEDDILLQAKQLLEKVVQPSTNKYDEGLLLFLQENICDITNKALKDDLSEQITTLVMQYKRKQRLLDESQAI